MERREDPSENTKENEKTNYVTTIPEEIWLCIFEFFDFKTLQKLLTLVCKEWFRIIRQSLKFSGQLNIIPGTKLSDFNLMLNSWKTIRVLQVILKHLKYQIKALIVHSKSTFVVGEIVAGGNVAGENVVGEI